MESNYEGSDKVNNQRDQEGNKETTRRWTGKENKNDKHEERTVQRNTKTDGTR